MNKVLLGTRYVRDIILNIFSAEKVVLITEPAQWSIYEDCANIREYLKDQIKIRIALTPLGLRNKVVHFASVGTLIKSTGFRAVHASNSIVLTWFHIGDTDESRLRWVATINDRVSYLHTSSTITAKELIAHGVHKEKIVIIPIGTDTQLFRPATVEEKGHIRKSLGLPLDKIIIGSFQKDGNGWGDGDTPKLVKGPDIFCDAVEMVAKDHPVHVLLTGPARGYVIKRLKRAGISHSHFLLPDANSSAMYYRALDVYVIASRAEGGPKAILEAVASGVPLVTTNVGMVPDIMHNGVDCLVAPVGDVGVLAKNIAAIVQDQELPDKLKREGYTTAQHYDIRRTVKEYYQKIYTHLLS